MTSKQSFTYWPFVFFTLCLFAAIASHYNGLYGQDAHAYFHFSENIRAVIWESAEPSNFFWPVMYPFLGAILSISPHATALSLQVVSLLSFAGIAFLLYSFITKKTPQKASHRLYVIAAFCLSPTPLLYAFATMADSLTVLFSTATFFFAFRFEQKDKNRDFLLATCCALAAFLTRYAAAVVVVIPCLWLCHLLISRKKWGLILKVMVLLPIVTLPHVWFKGIDNQALAHHWLANWDIANFFKSTFQTIDGLHQFPRPNITYVLQHSVHPRFLFFGILLLPFFRKIDLKTTFSKIVIGSILLYAFFLGGITYQSNRYLLPTYPLIVLLLYPAFQRCLGFLNSKSTQLTQLFLASVCLIQLVFFCYYINPYYSRNQLEQAIVQELNDHSATALYSFGVESALESYRVKQQVNSLWEKPYETFEEKALVIFNLKANEQQWAGRNPMINWQQLNAHYQLTKLKEWKGGWELFEIKKK